MTEKIGPIIQYQLKGHSPFEESIWYCAQSMENLPPDNQLICIRFLVDGQELPEERFTNEHGKQVATFLNLSKTPSEVLAQGGLPDFKGSLPVVLRVVDKLK